MKLRIYLPVGMSPLELFRGAMCRLIPACQCATFMGDTNSAAGVNLFILTAPLRWSSLRGPLDLILAV